MRVARSVLTVVLICAGGVCPIAAQTQAPGTSGSRTTLSGTPGDVRSPFFGGVPAGMASSEPIALALMDALARGLQHNLGVLMAEQSVRRAEGGRWLALNGLLPTLNGHVMEVRQQTNLKAFGFPLSPGMPSIIGPFNVFDARVYLSQPVFDLGAINAARAETHNISAARHAYKSARDLVVLVTANLYLQAIAASSRVESVAAQLETARALYEQALDLKRNGMIAAIGVLRAQVELNTQRQRATAAANEFEKAKLQLARVIGLPIGQAFTLSDSVPYAPVPEMTLDQALDRAYVTRPDYLAAVERVQAAEATRRAAVDARLPTVRFNADFGDIGLSVSDSHSTFSMAGVVNVPLFQGRDRGRLLQADADLRSRRAEADDAKATVYYDVRTAYLDLQASAQQLEVAAEARGLAAQQLTQARDRFAAGVADNLELVQAQETVAVANDQYIATLYTYNISKAALARALGIAEDAMQQYLGGSR